MPTKTITFKPNNHRIYQCPTAKKIGLINKLVEENSKLDILIVCKEDALALKESLADTSTKVLTDKELFGDKSLTCDYLISYDMPIQDIVYQARLTRVKEKAAMLLDESEQIGVHSIETLLGRAIKQESIEGFMYPIETVVEDDKPKRKKLTKDEITEIARQRHIDATVEKEVNPYREHTKEYKDPRKFGKKDDKKFGGKKSKPKKVGKKISIKARKDSEK